MSASAKRVPANVSGVVVFGFEASKHLTSGRYNTVFGYKEVSLLDEVFSNSLCEEATFSDRLPYSPG